MIGKLVYLDLFSAAGQGDVVSVCPSWPLRHNNSYTKVVVLAIFLTLKIGCLHALCTPSMVDMSNNTNTIINDKNVSCNGGITHERRAVDVPRYEAIIIRPRLHILLSLL